MLPWIFSPRGPYRALPSHEDCATHFLFYYGSVELTSHTGLCHVSEGHEDHVRLLESQEREEHLHVHHGSEGCEG